MASTGHLTQGRIFRLWVPLEAAWLLMAAEGPVVTAVMARMADSAYNLAGFGVAFGFAMFFESPIILIMSASTALAEDRESFLKLRQFTYALNAAITIALALFALPPVFRTVTGTLMGLDPGVARLAHVACLLFLPWPAAIGYRRFYQGVLIRHGLTRRVAYGTAIRLSSMALTALVLFQTATLPGAWVGASAMSVGVVLEAAASRFWAREPIHQLLAKETARPDRGPMTFASISHFYFPLALTSILMMGVNPLISFFLGRSQMALESLAVLPVMNSLIFIFVTGGLTFQEVAITLIGTEAENLRALKRFAMVLGAATTLGLLTLTTTPLLDLWLRNVAGLRPDLAAFAVAPMLVTIAQPAITTLISFQRALLVSRRTTRPITWAAGIEVAGIGGMLYILTQPAGWIGAIAATTAALVGRSAAVIYLFPKVFRTRGSDA